MKFGHRNNEADKLADIGRQSEDEFFAYTADPTTSRALHDGARLNALEMRDVYSILVKRLTKEKGEIRHPEHLEDAKILIQEETGLKPTTEKMINGIWKLGVYNRAKDLIWNLMIGKIKCGQYWRHIEGKEDRAYCKFCEAKGLFEVEETEHHLWLECEHNGQKQAWKKMKDLWYRTTSKRWPFLSIGLLRGIGALTLSDENGKPLKTKDSERLRIFITMTLWAIWKNRNNYAIQNIPVVPSEPGDLAMKMIKDLINKTWTNLRYEHSIIRSKKLEALRSLWAHDKIVKLSAGTTPSFAF